MAALAGALILHLFDPSQEGNPYPTCPFLFLTGLQCPGCGTTRALALITHGDLLGAAGMNPLTVLLLPFLLLVHVRWLIGTLRPGRALRPEPDVPVRVMVTILVGIVVFWVLRNLPWFSFLAAGTPLLPS
ncbi:membrane protein [Nocardiopsis kunsanensis]|uniref:Membrane protein n=1 Tax=Nocardiopsis kunsanensis TaxID=141693 RepID=A0A919CED4_9ACTN|nr:membrane protein [Nocardiopsis kunsanensis]